MPDLIRRFPFLAALLSPRESTAPPTEQSADVRPTVDWTPTRSNYPELEERRGEAMRRLFPKLYSWCASRWEWSMAQDVHAYLAGATSLEDLERRIRTVERRKHFGG